jgi:hypothetical protein
MSWSLQIRNGDLALDGNRLGQVTGTQKLVQDLRCAILEPRGHDDMHPTFGSLIDGGYDDNGRYVESVIATTDWSRAALQIRSEIQRLASDHQRRQVSRSTSDRRTFGESTLGVGELLVDILDIDMVQAADDPTKLIVTVTLQVGNGDSLTIDIPITNAPIL